MPTEKSKKTLSYPGMIALGFFIIAATGTLLLMLPAASRDGMSVGFVDAMFTAVSSCCVTGLVVFDTYMQWTLFGQIVILFLIQIGGLGFMTVVMMVSLFLRRKIGLAERSLMRESINTMHIGGIVRLTKRVLLGTLIIEGAGVVALSFKFIPQFGPISGIYCALWHSVSAFCNAGFDIMGRFGEYVSLTPYVGDITVNLTIMSLIVIGGLGFFVWDDIYTHGFQFKKYALHTKLVLTTTSILLVGGTLLFLLFERDASFTGLSSKERVLAAMFSAVTPRTAGFNTVDTAQLSASGRLLTMFLMFIGGSPGSTAGGIKTTTIAIILISMLAHTHGRTVENVFGRSLEEGAFRRAAAVFLTNLALTLTASTIICAIQPVLELGDVIFETFSAIGTVGMSTGITRSLSSGSRIIISMLMYCGRVGSLSFALIFTASRKLPLIRKPVEKINIG